MTTIDQDSWIFDNLSPPSFNIYPASVYKSIIVEEIKEILASHVDLVGPSPIITFNSFRSLLYGRPMFTVELPNIGLGNLALLRL